MNKRIKSATPPFKIKCSSFCNLKRLLLCMLNKHRSRSKLCLNGLNEVALNCNLELNQIYIPTYSYQEVVVLTYPHHNYCYNPYPIWFLILCKSFFTNVVNVLGGEISWSGSFWRKKQNKGGGTLWWKRQLLFLYNHQIRFWWTT